MFLVLIVTAASDILTNKPDFLTICVPTCRLSLSYSLSVLYFLGEAASFMA